MSDAIPNTFIIGGIALVAVVLIAIIIAYLVVRRSNVITTAIDTISMLPYIIPGSVVGIALVMAFNKKPLVLTGTVTIMVIALCIRRLPYTIRSSVAILQQIPVTIEEAAISLGATKMKTFFRITVPMMSNGIISGAIISWVTIITELSTAIILYNSKTITLTLAVYTFVDPGKLWLCGGSCDRTDGVHRRILADLHEILEIEGNYLLTFRVAAFRRRPAKRVRPTQRARRRTLFLFDKFVDIGPIPAHTQYSTCFLIIVVEDGYA